MQMLTELKRTLMKSITPEGIAAHDHLNRRLGDYWSIEKTGVGLRREKRLHLAFYLNLKNKINQDNCWLNY